MRTARLLATAASASGLVALAVACGSFSGADTSETDAGGADAPSSAEGGQAVDATSPETGGDGAASVAPTELAIGLDPDLEAIAVTPSTVYVAEHTAGRVLSIPIDGGVPSEIDAKAGSPLGIVVAGSYLFWTDFGGGKIKRRLINGGAIVAVTPTPGKNPSLIAAASDRIVVLAHGVGDIGEAQQYTFDLSAGPVVSGLKNPFDVAVFGGDIFWTESSSGGRIGRGVAGDGTNDTVTSPAPDAQSITADASGVYWTQPSAGLVRVSVSPGGPVDTLASNEVQPHSLVTDATSVYWLTHGGKLKRLAKGATPGTLATTIAAGFNTSFAEMRVRALAQNAQYLVWITTDGRVLRMAK